jgi:Rieske Fe-S protein
LSSGHEKTDTAGARVPETPAAPRPTPLQPGTTPEWPPAADDAGGATPPAGPGGEGDRGVTRGRFLKLSFAAAAGAVVAALGALTLPPLIAPALRSRSAGWVALGRGGAPTPGRVALPPKGAVARVTLTREVADAYLPRGPQTTIVFVANLGDGRYEVFDARCTHLGCPLVWDQVTRRFDCRCHGAVFDDRGEVVSGPAPRALDRYATKTKDGVLYVGGLEEA